MNDTPSNNNPPFPEDMASQSEVKRFLRQPAANTPNMADRVLAQFQSDLASPLPCQYDVEFLSAYLDGAVDSECADVTLIAQRLQTFEQHLPNCMPCNSQLGLLSDTIHAYRNFGYNCEKQLLSWSITTRVMNLLEQTAPSILDESVAMPEAGCGLFDMIQFSSVIDRSLSQKEESLLKAHSKECPPCGDVLNGLEQTQVSISGFYETAQPKAPSLWPRVEVKLSSTDENVVPFPTRKTRWMPAAAFGIAAAMMLFVFSGRMMPQLGTPSAPEMAASVKALPAQPYGDMLASNTSVIYSSPEAYLFSKDAEWIPDDMLINESSNDVSAIALGD